jgi:DNA-binding XRE family transcriptional regulator
MIMSSIDSIDMNDADARIMTPRTCKAARILLKMDQIELAKRARVNVQTVRNYENEESEPTHKTWLAIKRVLEAAGVAFIDENGGGPGVRLRKPG